MGKDEVARAALELVSAQMARSGECRRAYWPLDESEELVNLLVEEGYKLVSKAVKPKTYDSNITLLQMRKTQVVAGLGKEMVVTYYSSQGGVLSTTFDINTYLPELAKYS